MNINPFIQTVFGAIVGGLVVIATNWLNTTREKRKEVQEWYEQRYVTEGIDPLLVYLSNLLFHLTRSSNDEKIILPVAMVPVEALTRIEVLLGISGGLDYLSVFINDVNTSLSSHEEYQMLAVQPVLDLCKILHQLRQEVLKLIPNYVTRKNQELDITRFRERIVSLIVDYDEAFEALKRKEKGAQTVP